MVLRISFRTQELRRICLDHEYATTVLGEAVADSLQARLADLDAAEYLADVPLGVAFELSTLELIIIHLVRDRSLIGRADHVNIWAETTAQPPWDRINRIKLTDVQDASK